MPNTIASAKIGDDAAPAVEQRVLGWCRSHEGASVVEKRVAAKLIMEGFVQAYDDKAAEFAPVVRPPCTSERREAQVGQRVLTRTPV